MADINALREALAVSPANLPLLLLLAQALIEEKAFTEAQALYDRALALEAGNLEANLGRARVAFLAGRLSEADVRLESFLQHQKNNVAGWLLKCRILAAEKDFTAARGAYETAQSLPGFIADADLEKVLALPPVAPRPVVRNSGAATAMASDAAETAQASDLLADIERPAIGFKDVGGMEAIKEEIRMKILYPLQNRDLFRAYGKQIGGGVLIYGPPGCGKTLLSRATAGEIKASFIAVGLHEVLDMWLGNSEKNLHQLFETARSNAPCVMFFDEVDALASDRRDHRHSAGRSLINQFLAELDGNMQSNEGVLVLAATNAPWHLDPAFLRPGRFDRILFVPPPDDDARCAIVDLMARNRPVAQLDARAIARKTEGFTGADLKAVFDLTIERCLSAAMASGGRVVPLTTEELIKSARQVRSSARAWFESAKNYALYANQSGLYDDVLKHLKLRI